MALGISGVFFIFVWPQAVGFYSFITFASAGGLGVSTYIYHTKKHNKQLVCPVGSDCNAVINSNYSKFLGVSIEYWGMVYYLVIFVSYAILIFAPHLLSSLYLFGLVMFTAFAFLFSLYLLFAQGFLLRQWCIWCLLSATLSIAIFITSLVSIDFVVAFLVKITNVIEAFRAAGFTLGVGGATIAMFLFHRFLLDLKIDENEMKTLQGVSELIWLGLAFVLVSQFASFVAHTKILAGTGPFMAQTIALFVIGITSAVVMIIFTPFLSLIPFSEKAPGHHSTPLKPLRRPLFIVGTIALTSWYFAFMMNYVPEYELATLLLLYLVFLVISVTTALLWERRISKTNS